MEKNILLAVTLAWVTLITSQEIRAEEGAPPQTMEQRLSILERKLEIAQEEAEKKKIEGSGVTTGKDGFQIKSNDGNFILKISGVLQVDYREHLGDHGPTQFNDQFLLRRVRPTFEGTLNKYVGFRITPDFANGGGTTSGPNSSLLPDAYLDLLYFPAAKVRIGKIKPPVGLENIQSDPVLFFNERSLVTQLVPIRDNGVQLSGDFRNGQFAYQVAVLNGVADGFTSETDTGDGKDYYGRLFLQPFKPASSEWINGLGVGIAGSIGDQFGSATTSNLTSGYRTDIQQTFFTYTSGSFANGQRKRISPQGYWYFSHVGLLGEYVASSQEIKRVTTSTQTATVTNRAWQIAGSYVITGERPSFTGIKPRKVFDPQKRTWGAFEVVARYAVLQVDDEAFTRGFASLTSSAKKARSWSTGLNWYLNNNLRINSDYAVTSFDGGAAANQNRPTEKAILNRIQVTF
jgi:phosphate-selective porin OprO and OprP